jgi:hypothetical protein
MLAINIEIRTVDEYEAATRLIQKLTDAPEDSPEGAKVRMLLAAVAAWDAKHDDASAWKD